ncbi:MAG: hypothetical protein IJR50_03280 [Treponema sp.]|nr:hypothetical protein [Treponema sp.]
MNTIPLIFNEHQINRTVIGGRTRLDEGKINVAVVLLNSHGSQFRTRTLETLSKCGFAQIISLEPHAENCNLEEIAKKFPSITFIVPLEKVTDGDMINLGMSEARAPYVLVLRDSLHITHNMLQMRLAENLMSSGNYCIVPRLLDTQKNAVPVQFSPSAQKGKFCVLSSTVVKDGMHTLYPFDFIGLYDKTKFIQLGGFDYTITSPYYQNLDLALRSWLWGEQTCLSTTFLLSYSDEVPIEDTTADLTYLHFYLKNIAPRFKSDSGGVIPRTSFFSFLANSSCGIFEAHRQFADARKWVSINKSRFHTDMQHLIENWVTEV